MYQDLKASQTKFLCDVCTTHSKACGCHYKDFALILSLFIFSSSANSPQPKQKHKQTNKSKHHHNNKKILKLTVLGRLQMYNCNNCLFH